VIWICRRLAEWRVVHESGRPRRARHHSEQQRGQATVELALLMPFFALMLLAVVQVGLLMRTRVLVTHSAREAVRSAAVGANDADVRSAAIGAAELNPDRLMVQVQRVAGSATVRLTYRDPTDVPLVGMLVADAVFEAQATMRLE